jgi:hypothetical protein
MAVVPPPTLDLSSFNDFNEFVSLIQGNLNIVTDYNQASIGEQSISSVILAQIAYETALAQIQLEEVSAIASAENELNLQTTRSAQLLSLSGVENQLLMDQYREKILNMRADILNAKLQNSWTRVKNIATAFKY